MSGVKVVQGQPLSNYQELIMTNSATIDLGDPVTIDTNGFLKRSAAGEKIEGFFAEATKTVASNNQTVGLIKGVYAPVDTQTIIELTADQACTQTDVGAYADIAVSGSAVTADLAAGATGQLLVIDFDPNRDGTTTLVRCNVAEPQQLAFAQA